MKVLFIITRGEIGGAQIHVLDLLRGLGPKCKCELICGEEEFLTREARNLGIKCHVVPSLVNPISPLYDMRALWLITRIVSSLNPDIVHTHTSKAGLIGRLAARIGNVPSVYTAHTWCFAEGRSWHWRVAGVWLERVGALFSRRIVTVSEANRRLGISNRIGRAERLVTIKNGIVWKSLLSKEPLCPTPVILMVARFAPQKDHALLIETLATLNRPFKLVLVGDGPTVPLIKNLVSRSCLEAKVEFLGQRTDVDDLLRSAYVFVLTTHYEGLPISILEALRAGLPVIATDTGGVNEAVVDGQNGFLVPPGGREELAQALDSILSSTILQQRMGRQSRLMFEQHFTAATMLEKTLGVYRDVVANRDPQNLEDRLTPGPAKGASA